MTNRGNKLGACFNIDEEILNTHDCCLLLGISESNLRTMMKDKINPIPYSQLSKGARGTIRFLKSSVIEWVKSREIRKDVKKKKANANQTL